MGRQVRNGDSTLAYAPVKANIVIDGDGELLRLSFSFAPHDYGPLKRALVGKFGPGTVRKSTAQNSYGATFPAEQVT
jgi:hypothetical protein